MGNDAQATVPHQGVPNSGRSTTRSSDLASMLVCAFAATVVTVRGRGNWQYGLYYDEAWRSDLFRSSDTISRYLQHDTPIPVGWLLSLKTLLPFGYRPNVFRASSAVTYIVASALLGLFFAGILRRYPTGPNPAGPLAASSRPASPGPFVFPLLLGAATFAVGMSPVVYEFVTYFSNYPFEVAFTAAMLAATERAERSRAARRGAWILLVTAPLFTLGGLLLVPACGVRLLVLARRCPLRHNLPSAQSGRVGSSPWLRAIGIGAGGAVVWVGVAWFFLRPIGAKGSIRSFWVEWGASLGGEATLADLVGRSATQLVQGVAPQFLLGADRSVTPAAAVVVVLGLVVGVVEIARRSRWTIAAIVSAVVLSVAASLIARWPMTIERVNLPYTILVFFLVWIGLLRTAVLVFAWIGRCTSLGRGPFRQSLSVLGGIAMATLALSTWPQASVWVDPGVFARGLHDDLAVIDDGPPGGVLVISYHELAYYNAHDRLVNRRDSHLPNITLVAETLNDHATVYAVDPLLRTSRDEGVTTAWCVKPYALADRFQRACLFDPALAAEVRTLRGHDAEIVELAILPQ